MNFIKLTSYRFFCVFGFWLVVSMLAVLPTHAQTPTRTSPKDTTRNNKDARRRLYARWNDRLGNRLNYKNPRSPLFLKDPKNIKNEFSMTPDKKMSVLEKMGDEKTPKLNYRNPNSMSYEQFQQLQKDRVMNNLWRDYSANQDGKGALGGRGLLPKLDLAPALDRIFGNNLADFKPNGFVLLDWRVVHTYSDNPTIPLAQRSQTFFDPQQQININFNGKIGDKLGIVTNFDTKASFNFENQLKLNYKAEEQSLVQGVQAGNINWKLPTQLISGVENLFGAKLDFKFGRLGVSLIASQQRSRQQCITLRGGAQNRPFEIRADAYDENRNFFLSQFFRDNYERSLKNLPMITSGVIVTRVEVYVTNRNNNTETLRNFAAFSDLGESRVYNTAAVGNIKPNAPVSNDNNDLFSKMTRDNNVRQVDRTASTIAGYGLRRGDDYDLLKGARRLRDAEFRFHPQLGYISLLTAIKNDEILAVAYEYTYNGRPYKVGELTEDYQSRNSDEVLVLKLLKSSTLRNNTQNPMWNLMMKNVYSLGTSQVAKQGFQLRVVYKDDFSGLDNPNLQEGKQLQNVPLLRVMGLDRLNSLSDPQPDGNFDFVEGTTIDSRFGKVIFPVLEPFGNSLAKKFEADEEILKNKYVFSELYTKTQIEAQQLTEKNKYFLKGTYQGAAGGGIVQLPYGVSEQSVQVKAAGAQLQRGMDYEVDAQIGQVRFLNESVTNSGRDIEVCYEQPDLFQNQTRTTLGTRLEYTVSPDLKIGSTLMRLRETPTGYISRTAIGNEPVNNTMLGADISFRKESRLLTKMIDALPLLQTKEPSSIQFQGEVARLYAGISPQAKDRSFIDDFEAARTPFDYTRQPLRWRLGATPLSLPESQYSDLRYGYRRAHIAAYTIDNTFQGSFSSVPRPQNLTDDDLENFYEKGFQPQDIFTGRSQRLVNLPEALFDVAYFPTERGMYNFNPDLDPNGRLKTPRKNFGAITRAVSSDPDFDNANIENVEFWLMDPFKTGKYGVVRAENDATKNTNNNTGGKMYIHLGEIPEDVMKNGRYDFENGLPLGEKRVGTNITNSDWGQTTKQQFLLPAFSNEPEARKKQDVGLDGLSNEDEKKFFSSYLQSLPSNLSPAAKAAIEADPSADDFQFYFSPEADVANKKILERYKHYNGMENNSPESAGNSQVLTPASLLTPDIEDLNNDNTINDLEQYYEYDVPLKPGELGVGKKYIVDKVTATNKAGETIDWYLFRIPVREFTNKYGGINGFKNIRFMRLYMTDWEQPVVLRFAQFQMVATQYRKYVGDLNTRGLQEVPEPYDARFVVSTVSAEENSSNSTGANKYVYASPPGFDRDVDFTQTNFVQLNEQAMSLCVTNLRRGDSRAAFKNVNLNLLLRKRLRMFVHLHNDNDESGQVSSFLRFGTDVTENYYEIEVSNLKATPRNDNDRRNIWPLENEIDVAFDDIIRAKAERDKQGRPLTLPFTLTLPKDEYGRQYKITIVGKPDLSAIMMLMIGVKNPRDPTGINQEAKSFCVWVDELHATGLESQTATAAIGTLNLKLADFATIQATGRYSTFGFGSIQQKPADRSRDNLKELSVSVNMALDKLLPQKWGLKIPLYVNYDNRSVRPHYNPLDPDMPLNTALDNFAADDPRRAQLENVAIESAIRKGFNFSNVRKIKTNPNAKKHLWDIENLSFTYAYNEFTRRNSMIADNSQKQYKGGIAYQYSFPQRSFEPFKNVKSLDRPYLELIKNINLSLLPTQVSIRYDADRNFMRTIYRSSDLTTNGQVPLYEKYFLVNKRYDLQWNLTKNLTLSYSSLKNSVVDEPVNEIDTKVKQDSLWGNFWHNNRAKAFDQTIKINYRIPLEKFPLLDWMTADYNHTIRYQYSPTDGFQTFGNQNLQRGGLGNAYNNPYNNGYSNNTSSSGLNNEFTVNTIGSQMIPNSYNLKDSAGVAFGTTIRNSKEWGLSGKVDFVKLYNKIRYLNFANRPSAPRKNFARSPGDDEEITREPSRLMKNITRFLMAVRGIDVTYSELATTTLSGFLPTESKFMGIDRYEGLGNNPLLPFIFGKQDPYFHYKIADLGRLSKSTELNQPFIQTISKTFSATATLEPVKDLRIRIQARRTRGDEFRDLYRYQDSNVGYTSLSGVRNGTFEMSFISFKTAFEKVNLDNSSETYDRFKTYREVVLKNLTAQQKGVGDEGKYVSNSQDVLIASFFAAYNGKSVDQIKIDPFPNLPLPNWSVNYSGLSQLKPFKKIFSSFSLEHNYQSTYSVGNFTSSLSYEAQYVNLAVRSYEFASKTNEAGLYVPRFLMSTITLSERFSPLIGITARTVSKIDFNLKYDRSRNVALNLSNATMAELFNKNISLTVGFTKNNVKIPFKINGKYQRLKNDLRFSCTLMLQDYREIIRNFGDEQPIPLAGSTVSQYRDGNLNQYDYSGQFITPRSGGINFQFAPQLDYTVSKLWSIQLYYTSRSSRPLTTLSYYTANSAGGVRIRFNIAEL